MHNAIMVIYSSTPSSVGPLPQGYQWDAPNPMPPAHSEVSVATAVGDLQLCPPTRDPTALWCTVQVCPLALKLLAPDALE